MIPQQLARFGGTSRPRAVTPSLHSTIPIPMLRDTHISGGIVNVAGRDNINNTYNQVHYHAPTEADLQAILEAIPNFRQIHQDTLDRATPGTGVWLLKSEELRVWLEPNGDLKIMWGSGIPGAGKTILAALVIAMLESLAEKQGKRLCIAYVYIRYSDRTAMTLRSVFEVLVKQTVERHPDCLPIVEQAYARHISEGTQPTESQLLALLQELTSRTPTVYVLDALDEAPTDIQLDLVEKLATLNCKLFITSRPLKAVEAHFPTAHTFPIVAQEKDIDLLIDQRLKRSPALRGLFSKTGALVRDEIVHSVKRNCGGMFLHASLQLDSISQCLSIHDIRKTLEAFPAQIEEAYLQTWSRILNQSPNHALLARTILLWIVNTQRSMTIEELEHAVATSPDDYKFDPDRLVPGASLIGLCHGLVTVEENSRLVRLVHYTAKDTLERLLNDYYPHPHSLLATICMTHLTDCGFQNTSIDSAWELERVLKGDPLLAYAHGAWAFHAQQSLDVEYTGNKVANFIANCYAFPVLIDHHWGSFDLWEPLHIVAFYNFPVALAGSHAEGKHNASTREKGYSPLILACWQGHQSIAYALLCLATIAVNTLTNSRESALSEAVSHGHKGIVKLLLAHPDINVNIVTPYQRSVLSKAASKGDEGIVKLLLAHPEVDVNIATGSGWSPLAEAAFKGHEGIVKLLLAHPEIRVNTVSYFERSALAEAFSMGHEGVVQLLLAHPEIDVNIVTGSGRSALAEAAGRGDEGTVKLLLAHPKIEVNIFIGWGQSALADAVSKGHEGIVKLLLAHPETEVNVVASSGRSALAQAAVKGDEGIVRLLLAHPEISVNIVTGSGRSILAEAASMGHKGTVKLLLAHPGIDVNTVGYFERSALAEAASNGHRSIVKLLLAHPKIDPNIVTSSGWSALTEAAFKGHEDIVKLLLARLEIMIKVNIVTSFGWSALTVAAFKGHEGIVKLLLAHPEIEANAIKGSGRSALAEAVSNGHGGIVRLLIARPEIDVNIISGSGLSPLAEAASKGHEGIVVLLLGHPEIDVTIGSALLEAASKGHKSIVKLLLSRPAIEVDFTNPHGLTALQIASKHGHSEVVSILLAVSDTNTTQIGGSKIAAADDIDTDAPFEDEEFELCDVSSCSVQEKVDGGPDDVEEDNGSESIRVKRKATTLPPAQARPAKRARSAASNGKATTTFADEGNVGFQPTPRGN